MGVDIFGTYDEAKLEAERDNDSIPYFRNNWWWWRPLWDYLAEIKCITKDEHESGHYNCGPILNRDGVIRVRKALRESIDSGAVAAKEAMYEAQRAATPDVPCRLCNGTGDREDLVPAEWKEKCGGCNGCNGKGTVRPTDSLYPFSAENAIEFCEFLERSEGMTIY